MRNRVEIYSCDRCGKTINESEIIDTDIANGDNASPQVTVAGSAIAKAVTFEDLCDSCQSRINTLTEEIRRGKGRGKKKKEGKAKGKTKAA